MRNGLGALGRAGRQPHAWAGWQVIERMAVFLEQTCGWVSGRAGEWADEWVDCTPSVIDLRRKELKNVLVSQLAGFHRLDVLFFAGCLELYSLGNNERS